jgi:hypothetical protein
LLNPDGTFNFMIASQSDTYFSAFNLNVVKPTGLTSGRFNPAVETPDLDGAPVDSTDPGVGDGTPQLAMGAVARTAGNYSIASQSPASETLESPDTSGLDPASWCFYNGRGVTGATYIPVYRYLSYFSGPDKVQRVETGAHSTLSYAWSNSTELSNQIGVEYKLEGVKYSAGVTKTLKNSSGATFNVGSNQYVDLAVAMKFSRYQLGCQPYNGNTPLNPIDWTSYDFDYPDYSAGGTHVTTVGGSVWACKSANEVTETKGDPIWVARSSTSIFNAGVSYPGVDLQSKETDNSTHKLTYNFTANTYLCGNNDVPTTAQLIREK